MTGAEVVDFLFEMMVVVVGLTFFMRGMWKEHTFSMAVAAAMFSMLAAMG